MNFYDISNLLEINPILLFIIIVWTVIWKGIALWKSAHKEQPIWFVVLLVVNTLGILEILYIFLFSEMKNKRVEKVKSPSRTKSKSSKKRK